VKEEEEEETNDVKRRREESLLLVLCMFILNICEREREKKATRASMAESGKMCLSISANI
jgi:hypothetical protein